MTKAKSKNKPPRSSAKARRSAARLAAVQLLYQASLSGQKPAKVLDDFLAGKTSRHIEGPSLIAPDPDLLKQIVLGVHENQKTLVSYIKENIDKDSQDFPPETLLMDILSAGIFEIAEIAETDTPIIINDYLNIAHAFYGGREPALINGILDRLARRLRPQKSLGK